MSYNNKKNRIEERVYSVTMTEDELSLFSEFLEQKEFEAENSSGVNILQEWNVDPITEPELHKKIEFYRKEYNRNRDWVERTKERQLKYERPYNYLRKDRETGISSPEELYHIKKSRNTDFDKTIERYSQDRDRAKAKLAQIYKSRNYNKLSEEEKDLLRKIESENGHQYTDSGRRQQKEKYAREGAEYLWENIKPTSVEREREHQDALKKILPKESPVKKYDPKTDKPLVEIDEDIPTITEREEEEHTPELIQFQEDRKNGIPLPTFPTKREKFIESVKKFPEKVNEKYKDITGRESLSKDTVIAAGVTAGLGAGAYALHKHLKNKKKEKELAEGKYKTDSDKKKEDKKKK